MNKKIKGNSQYNSNNFKFNYYKSKSPKLRSNLIQKNVNEKNYYYDKNDNVILNNNSVKKIKMNKIIFLLKNEHETEKENINLDKMKQNQKKENNNIKNVINNQINKNIINNNQNQKRKNNTKNENKKIIEKNEEKNKLKNEEEEKLEDIADYINIAQEDYNLNYININKKIVNEAIEEVEEAKEMSELKQPSDLMIHVSNSKQSIAKNSEIRRNKNNFDNKEYNKPNMNCKRYKMPMNKRFKKKINLSPPLKRIEIVMPKYENFYNNIKKNSFKMNNIDIKKYNNDNNIENNLIVQKNNDILGESENKSNYIILEKNMKRNPKHQFKKIYINKKNPNILDSNKNNKSNINLKDNSDKHVLLKTDSNIFKNINNSSNPSPNVIKIINNKRQIKSNKLSTGNQLDEKQSIIKKIKIREKKSPFMDRFIYNDNSKSLSIENKKKKGNNNNKEFYKVNKHKKIMISDDKDKKLDKTNGYDENTSTYQYKSFDKVKLTINKIKNSEEKYHKLLADYYSREEKSKNRAFIKEALIKRKNN